jgi:hypothetical protein
MNSKRIFSWSKRQSSSETYYRTGGLLPIEANGEDSGNGLEVQVRQTVPENFDALAERINVVAQNEATHALSLEGCAGKQCMEMQVAALWTFIIR